MNGYYYYEPLGEKDQKIENINSNQKLEVFKQIPIYKCKIGDTEIIWNLRKWFVEEHDSQYSIGFNPLEKTFFDCEHTGKKYVNMSKGFLHKEIKKYKYSDDIKENVNRILQHIKMVWNSGNKE
jgi:hypothetical protein